MHSLCRTAGFGVDGLYFYLFLFQRISIYFNVFQFISISMYFYLFQL